MATKFAIKKTKTNFKVYPFDKLNNNILPRYEKYYDDYIPIELIENLRLTKVYTPKVLYMMSNPEYFDCWWGNTQADRDDASAFLKRFKEKYNK